jgi:pimeloyl-ACP methyl ester carboxylesterase
MLLSIGISLFLSSPGKTPLFLDSDGNLIEDSVAEVRDIEINGVKQRVLIRGVNKRNPLLLHLHGGPGGPDQTILQSHGKTLEDFFTVVYWDQRGSGASYYAKHLDQPLTFAQLAQE